MLVSGRAGSRANQRARKGLLPRPAQASSNPPPHPNSLNVSLTFVTRFLPAVEGLLASPPGPQRKKQCVLLLLVSWRMGCTAPHKAGTQSTGE